MKKFIIWISVIIVGLVLLDFGVDFAMRKYMEKSHLKGDYRSVDYLLNNPDDELIVLGSSVSLNSINTKTLQDSLGIKSYNGGSNGQALPFYQTLLEVLADNSKVKYVILGIVETNLTDTGMGQRYSFLAPYYGHGFEGIDKRLESQSDYNNIFLKSALYRYNTAWFRILLYHFYEPGLKGENGFIAKDIPAFYPNKLILTENQTFSKERAEQLDSIVSLCKKNDIQLTVCLTPQYAKRDKPTSVEKELRNRARQGQFELWYDTQLPEIANDSTLFYDNNHLNYLGAEKYTSIITERLKSKIK